ncbi:ATP-dependent zinc protease family protein [Marilutibacter maris]|nr:RimK/LysX family protein [Lysobacter maris]
MSNVMPSAERIVLGWREWVALPALGLAAVRAKVDSGARTSALHVDRQWRFVEGGAPWVGFSLTPGAGEEAGGDTVVGTVEAAAPVIDEREVTDSGGHTTRRVFLRTTMRLAGIEREIEINLSDRRGMLFPMLLGRTAIATAFTIDPARSFLHGRPPAGAVPLLHRRSPTP